MRKRSIIRSLLLLAVLAVAYTGYWFWLARTFEQQLALWIDQQRAMGYRITYSAGEATGFPLRAVIELADLSVASPAGAAPWRFKTKSVLLSLAPWRPLAVRIQDSISTTGYSLTWSSSGREFEIFGAGVSSTIELSNSAATPPVAFLAEHLDLRGDDHSIANTYRLSGTIAPANGAGLPQGSIEFAFDADQFNLVLGSPAQAENKEFYSPSLSGKLIGSIPAGSLRDALAEWSRQGGYLDLTNISADASPPGINASAALALDPRLQPIGAGTVTLRDYIPGVDWVVQKGLMTKAEGVATKMWLSARAQDDNGALKVTLPITIQDGFVSLGAAKVAQLPPIRWQ